MKIQSVPPIQLEFEALLAEVRLRPPFHLDGCWLKAAEKRIRKAPDLRSCLVTAVAHLAELIDWETSKGTSPIGGLDYASRIRSIAQEPPRSGSPVPPNEDAAISDWVWIEAERMFTLYEHCHAMTDWHLNEALCEGDAAAIEPEEENAPLPQRELECRGGFLIVLYYLHGWITGIECSDPLPPS